MNLQNALLAICLHLFVAAAAQTSASAIFDRNTVETGDTFVLRVLVAGVNAQPGTVDFSSWRELLPPENILSQTGWTRSGNRWMCQFTLIAFDSALLQLPPLKVPLRLGDTLRSNPLALTVRPTYATADLNEAEPIRDIWREPMLWVDHWPWAAGALAGLALMIWLWRRRKKRPVAAPSIVSPSPVPVVPPHQVALQKLNVLEQKQPWKHGQLEPFYAELSLIVREYLEGRFGIPALESTTREILPLLKTVGFPENLRDTARQVLHESDMTKFAQHPPPAHFHEKALNMARQLILATTPRDPSIHPGNLPK